MKIGLRGRPRLDLTGLTPKAEVQMHLDFRRPKTATQIRREMLKWRRRFGDKRRVYPNFVQSALHSYAETGCIEKVGGDSYLTSVESRVNFCFQTVRTQVSQLAKFVALRRRHPTIGDLRTIAASLGLAHLFADSAVAYKVEADEDVACEEEIRHRLRLHRLRDRREAEDPPLPVTLDSIFGGYRLTDEEMWAHYDSWETRNRDVMFDWELKAV